MDTISYIPLVKANHFKTQERLGIRFYSGNSAENQRKKRRMVLGAIG